MTDRMGLKQQIEHTAQQAEKKGHGFYAAELYTAIAEIERLEARDKVREDYPLRCGDCGRAHFLDCSLPSGTWNQIARPEETLCVTCIDDRLATAGLQCDEAEFYYAGTALASKLYTESHGEVARLRAERYVAVNFVGLLSNMHCTEEDRQNARAFLAKLEQEDEGDG